MSSFETLTAGVGLTARGLWERRWLSLVVFVTAALAAAIAAVGPLYTDAARTAIVRDAITEAAADAQGVMVIWNTPLQMPPVMLGETTEATGIPEVFQPPIRSAELPSKVLGELDAVKLIWREGACAQLRLVSGRCPEAPGEVVASRATSERYHWEIGGPALLEALVPPDPPGTPESNSPDPLPLAVVGIYEPVDPEATYWFGVQYFPDSTGSSVASPEGQRLYDPLFTEQSTLEWSSPAASPWDHNVTLFLGVSSLTGDDVESLRDAPTELREWAQGRATVFTALEATARAAIRGQSTLDVPVTIVTLELVGLTWLLLFLGVRDLVRARRLEIGLARLRGLSRLQTWRFALGQPVVLLLAALPIGVLLGVVAVQALTRFVLDPSIAVSADSQAWLAAAGAIAGGLLAAVLAARATVTMPVMEQWRKTPLAHEGRGWVLDAIVLTLVVAGLVGLVSGGPITESSGQQATALLVPVLMSIAAALITIRVLPLLTRATFSFTDRRRGIGSFIGLRLAARSQTTASTLIVLTVAFSLAVFAVAAWTVTTSNHHNVATVHNGAATVFEVTSPPGLGVTDLVDRVDPDGRSAMSVAINDDAVAHLLAVDIDRFPYVANWQPGFTTTPLDELLPQLRPPASPQIIVSGDQIRVTVDSRRINDPQVNLAVDLELPERTGRVTLPFEPMQRVEGEVLTRPLSRDCLQQCELRGLTIEPASRIGQAELTINKIEVHTGTGWQTIDAGLNNPESWRAESESDRFAPETNATSDGLHVAFLTDAPTRLVANTHPPLLPALTVGTIGPRPTGHHVNGLDGIIHEEVDVVAQANALPGARGTTALVDLQTADRSAFGITSKVVREIWVAPGAETRIKQAIQDEGATITAERGISNLEQRFNRQGPGLALALLLVTAAAGAILATARSALGLYTTGRQRPYQFAALTAIGASKREQRTALLIEQAITLGAGILAGTAAGLTAAAITLRRIPQFTNQPTTPPLNYTPDPLVVAAAVGISLVAIAIVVTLTTEAIRRTTKIDQLRQAAP